MTITILKSKEITKDIIEKITLLDKENLKVYLNDPFTTHIGIIKDNNDEIIAVGMIRIVNEFKVIINNDKSNFEVSRALKELIKQGLACCLLHGSNEIYSMITIGGEHYEKLLEKHFNFYKVDAIPMKVEI